MGGRAISEKSICSFSALKYTLFFILCLLFLPFFPFGTAIDTINPNQNITGRETLVSRGKTFELGFFSPDKRSPNKSYLGIWYHGIHLQTIVWVANREKPVLDHQGVFAMKNDGNLQVMDGNGSVLWTPWDSGSIAKSESQSVPNATLHDEGNLVLRRGEDILWQSFTEEAESNTFLPGMNMKTKKLRSWKSNSDPARGDFSFEVYNGSIQLGEISISLLRFIIQNHSDTYWMSGLLRFIIHNHSDTYWISGWSSFNDVPENLLSIMIPDNNEAITTLDVKNRLVINSSGHIEFFRWINENNTWSLTWTKPSDVCSFYRVCGDYGVCNVGENNKPDCTCLPGFVPTSKAEWGSGNYTRGCGTSLPGCSENDPFVDKNLDIVRSPDGYFEASSEEDCKNYSRRNCCSAYFFETVGRQGQKNRASVCWTWSSDVKLKDIISDDSFVGNLKFRLYDTAASGSNATTPIITRNNTNIERKNSSDGSSHGKPLLLIIPLSTTGIVLTAVAAVGIGCFWRRMAISKGQRYSIFQNQESDHGVNKLLGFDGFPEDRTKSIDVPFFSFEMIVAATDDFSVSNKLGQGGFGPVYKGKFPGGKEIAVKRLSRSSGQGLEEFKNEVLLIAKLQHRNLVRLLGYCMKGDEKMLIYEYMPNKSLDAIVFRKNPEKGQLLNWDMRYNIILGVARGLLYLHQDSRLRIIHRDLKTRNILLDEEMNPKISDFGMARIFGGTQIQANTTRVVGTYGYMSPEYAIDGLFSIKSDVFSFGVVVLEIISGKRNALFYHKEEALTLLGYAWKLWHEDTALDLMDPSLCEDYNEGLALKGIQIALLCVQDDAADRPTMTEVVSMLSSEIVVVPNPRQPIFVVKRFFESLASSSNQGPGSNNELTITFNGR